MRRADVPSGKDRRCTDTLEGGPGNDLLHAGGNDGAADVVDCGAGFDRAVAVLRPGDTALDCERVRTLSP